MTSKETFGPDVTKTMKAIEAAQSPFQARLNRLSQDIQKMDEFLAARLVFFEVKHGELTWKYGDSNRWLIHLGDRPLRECKVKEKLRVEPELPGFLAAVAEACAKQNFNGAVAQLEGNTGGAAGPRRAPELGRVPAPEAAGSSPASLPV